MSRKRRPAEKEKFFRYQYRPKHSRVEQERDIPATDYPGATAISLQDFASTTSYEQRAEIAKAYEQRKSGKLQLIAGDMHLELATMAFGLDERMHHLLRAQGHWQEVLKKQPVNESRLRAAMQLAHLGIYKSMYLARQTPDASDVQITYGALLDLGKEISHALEPNTKIGNDRRGAIVGVASELGIMQLLYRFIIKTDSHEWAVMPSLLSENHSTRTHQSDLREGWDVGVYEQYSASNQPSLLFKAQVKSSKKRAEESRYAPGIAVIYALHDLCTPGEYMLHPSTISDECFYETFSSDMESVGEVTKKLDQREQLLLDILG